MLSDNLSVYEEGADYLGWLDCPEDRLLFSEYYLKNQAQDYSDIDLDALLSHYPPKYPCQVQHQDTQEENAQGTGKRADIIRYGITAVFVAFLIGAYAYLNIESSIPEKTAAVQISTYNTVEKKE